jgi:hypothetical protein
MPVWTELRGINALDLLLESDTGDGANPFLLESDTDGTATILLESEGTDTTWTQRAALSDL